MIDYKSPADLDRMRRAGRIVVATIERVLEAVRPGGTTADLDAVAEAFIREQGAIPSFKGYGSPPFPGSICASLNDEVVHGIPTPKRVLREGDLLSLDFGAIWEGFHGDSAVSVFVGEPPSPEAEKLVRVTEEALEAGISQIRPGARLRVVEVAPSVGTITAKLNERTVMLGLQAAAKIRVHPISVGLGKKRPLSHVHAGD